MFLPAFLFLVGLPNANSDNINHLGNHGNKDNQLPKLNFRKIKYTPIAVSESINQTAGVIQIIKMPRQGAQNKIKG